MSTDTENSAPVSVEPVEIDLDRALSIADVHADESREDGSRIFDRGGILAFARDVLRVAAPVTTQPDLTQQTLDDVNAGIPARDADPLQGAADWLVKDCGVSDPARLANRLGIGYNRASRLIDAARKEQ